MTSDNALYFLADFERYKRAKINLLSAKSNLLMSTEKIKSLIELRSREDKYRTKIAKDVNSVRLNIRKLIQELPKTENQIIEQKEENIPRKKRGKNKSSIRSELDEINKKLTELETL